MLGIYNRTLLSWFIVVHSHVLSIWDSQSWKLCWYIVDCSSLASEIPMCHNHLYLGPRWADLGNVGTARTFPHSWNAHIYHAGKARKVVRGLFESRKNWCWFIVGTKCTSTVVKHWQMLKRQSNLWKVSDPQDLSENPDSIAVFETVLKNKARSSSRQKEDQTWAL